MSRLRKLQLDWTSSCRASWGLDLSSLPHNTLTVAGTKLVGRHLYTLRKLPRLSYPEVGSKAATNVVKLVDNAWAYQKTVSTHSEGFHNCIAVC